ncbi:hypothetical protein AMECASPLE_035895, partial [Ameca splendens]
ANFLHHLEEKELHILRQRTYFVFKLKLGIKSASGDGEGSFYCCCSCFILVFLKRLFCQGMMKNLLICAVFMAMIVTGEALICNSCRVGFKGTCLFASTETCNNSQSKCYKGNL